MDDQPQELEYVLDAYVKVWATSLEEALDKANKALVETYNTSRVDVELFDAYGINDADGNEIRPVS